MWVHIFGTIKLSQSDGDDLKTKKDSVRRRNVRGTTNPTPIKKRRQTSQKPISEVGHDKILEKSRDIDRVTFLETHISSWCQKHGEKS